MAPCACRGWQIPAAGLRNGIQAMSAAMIERGATSRMATKAPTQLAGLPHRLPDKADSEYRLFGLVQQFHVPFGVLFQAARNAAEQIAADRGHLGPGGFAALEFSGLFVSAGIAAMTNPKEIKRHRCTHVLSRPHSLSILDKLDRKS